MSRANLRWRAATTLSRLPWTCQAHLITWALGYGPALREAVTRGHECRTDAARCPHGCCYCGKFR